MKNLFIFFMSVFFILTSLNAALVNCQSETAMPIVQCESTIVKRYVRTLQKYKEINYIISVSICKQDDGTITFEAFPRSFFTDHSGIKDTQISSVKLAKIHKPSEDKIVYSGHAYETSGTSLYSLQMDDNNKSLRSAVFKDDAYYAIKPYTVAEMNCYIPAAQ